jgi:hypothetical protein
VKWNDQRSYRPSHSITLECLWVAWLSRMAWTVLPADLALDGCRQHDPGAPDVLLRAVAVINDFLQALAISRAQMDGDAGAHSAHSHGLRAKGIPPGTLMTASIH